MKLFLDAAVSTSAERVYVTVYVTNVPHSCDVPELTKLFNQYGPVIDCEVAEKHEKRQAKITMACIACASAAMRSLNKKVINGRVISTQSTRSVLFDKTH